MFWHNKITQPVMVVVFVFLAGIPVLGVAAPAVVIKAEQLCQGAGSKSDNVIAECAQASAILEAAKIAERASDKLTIGTMVAGILAFFGSIVAAILALYIYRHTEQASSVKEKARGLNLFCAEIEALLDFLKRSEFQKSLESEELFFGGGWFYPGAPEKMLSVYFANSESLSALKSDVASKIVKFYIALYEQFGILIALQNQARGLIERARGTGAAPSSSPELTSARHIVSNRLNEVVSMGDDIIRLIKQQN